MGGRRKMTESTKMFFLIFVCLSLANLNAAATITPSASSQMDSTIMATQSSSEMGMTSMATQPLASASQEINPTSSAEMPMSSTQTINFGFASADDFRMKITFTLDVAWKTNYADANHADRTDLDNFVINALNTYFSGNNNYVQTEISSVNETSDSKIAITCITNMKNDNGSAYTSVIAALTVELNTGMGGSLNVVANTASVVAVVNGEWGNWIAGECVDGKRNSTRICNGPYNGGSPCVGDDKKTEDCTMPNSMGTTIMPVFTLSAIMILFATSLCLKL